jgi:CRP-like cAMP-binding protein
VAGSTGVPADPVSSAAGSPLLRGLAQAEVEAVLAAATARRTAEGEVLFIQGGPVEALYVVESGLVRLSQTSAEGDEVVVRTIGPGGIIAGIAILEKRTLPVTATVVAAGRVLLWRRPVIQALAARHPAIRLNVLATIADRMQDSLSRLREVSTENVGQRVARALLRLARESGRAVDGGTLIDRKLGRQELAQLAGASMFTASRLVAEWARDGVLEVGRQRVIVRSLVRLAQLAGDATHG